MAAENRSTVVHQAPMVWRLRESEMDIVCPWLLPALQKRWPRLNSDGISHWFKSAMADRRTLFARTANMAGMWHSLSDVLEPTPVIVEKFVRGTDYATNEEACVLYGYMKEWAKQIGARECVIGMDSDASMGHAVQSLQSLSTPCKKRTVYTLSMQGE